MLGTGFRLAFGLGLHLKRIALPSPPNCWFAFDDDGLGFDVPVEALCGRVRVRVRVEDISDGA